ncbi:cell surface protein [Methanosarcina siciliae C2J]|uniref:Cell surface protein n=1 Tax=Methanosarcina siciliae C2J TaxID=1434118 RepID=A0A0E3LD62_9EURY|nr:PKD domain-containing protein [Methanosarcina siciliae]AKB36716.1 cell surface protein [Methanosarcina siciliae C2J]
MKINKKLYSIALASTILVFVFSILISSIALAAQEIKLSKDIGENGETSIYGDKVVWSYWGKIHLYDLKTGNDTIITMPEHYYASHPAIYDNKIVCCLINVNENPVRRRLYVYDILNSTGSLIAEKLSYCVPDIYGDRIVWAEERNYKTDIYMYNISTQMKTQITTSGSASNPSIHENKIVWVGYGDNGTIIDKNNNSIGRLDLYMYDLSTSKETRITTSGLVSNPAIYNDRIVWQDSRNSDFTKGRGDVYMYNLSTEKESRISYSGQSSSGSPPAIYGDRIVWQNHHNGNYNIYMYNLSTQKETQITTSGSAYSPDIYGDRIVYSDNRQRLSRGDGDVNFSDVYVYDLTAGPIEPQAGFTSNVTSGIAPLTVLFTDTSTGGVPTSWHWDTGDGIYSKHAMNATHTFTEPGVYNVTLTVENEAGNSTVTKPNYINVTPPQPPVADFYANVTSGKAPLMVSFYGRIIGKATSKGEVPVSWYWDFGEGIYSKYTTNAIHTFTKPGIYTVNLTVGNFVGNSTATKPNYIVVIDPKAPDANFSSNIIEGYVPLTVQFNDTSQNSTSRVWDFDNNGKTDSTDINPVYTFTTPGIHTVNLTVRNAYGTTSKTDTIIVLTENEIRITTSGLASHPDIYGNRIVWQDLRNGNYDIYMYDLSTSRETRITANESNQTYPSLYCDRIVWQDDRNGQYDIYMYNISTSKETQISTSGRAQRPKIYGDRIMWMDYRTKNKGIYVHDLSTSKETRIISKGIPQYINMQGNLIVWHDLRYISPDIYMYDLSTSKETQITSNGEATFPNVYGNRIVWQEWHREDVTTDIYMYDLSTSKKTQITTNKSSQYYPAIYGNKIVWGDFRNEYVNIYMYDLSTQKETQITTSGGTTEPDIYGNRIVYRKYSHRRLPIDHVFSDIYMYDLTAGPIEPQAGLTSNVTLEQHL